MKKIKFQTIILFFLIIVLSLVAFFSFFYYRVSSDASAGIERGAIKNIIFSESPVYYDDGENVIGVFFEKTHRKYIQYKDIPSFFTKAIIASEDRNFFNHNGFDMRAILRAFIANIKAGKTVQGGSTITQQTAKNIFKRQKRSYRAKLKELIQALLLEKKYTKKEILEMYVNQFFVTGFGSGLRIAAQYFFDKKAEKLDLVESAFIAGLVKGPNRYNPFTKKTEAEKKEVTRLAKLRKDYVLSNMWMLKFITKDQYLKAKDREVPFKEGAVTYRLNVILDYIREQLESDFFRAILQEEGVDNIATSGIKIYTSVNKEIQAGAMRSIRRHLPLLDTKLSGYNRDLLQDNYRELAGESLRNPKTDLPFLCRITNVNNDKLNPYLMVAWDNGGGIVDYEGLKPVGEAWLKGKLGEWALFDKTHISAFLKNFHAGDLVPVQLLETGENSSQARLMLSKIPELEGGVIVLNRGMIRAMVGGFFDRFFNRAMDAKRQLGSIFKPLVYTSALQLKWNSLDPLINMRDLFRFENTRYLPKPDHKPRSNKVSMAWAGAKSENLATVWLLYHLTDHLNMSEFHQVLELVGLDRKKDESYGKYAKRIRDKHGVVVDREALMEAAFEESKKEIEPDLIFSGHEHALDTLKRLHFSIDTKELNLKSPDEYQIYRLSFQRLRSLNFEMKRKFKKVKKLSNQYREKKDPDVRETLSRALRYFYVEEKGTNSPRVVYTVSQHKTNLPHLQPITPEWLSHRLEWITKEETWIDGLITSKFIDLVQLNMKKNYKRLLTYKRYDTEVLSRIRDFRTLVNLAYVVRLSENLGISTKLDPVLSFPLGANSISITEAALAYHSILTGKVYPFRNRTAVPIITRIVDRDGEIIWEYRPQPKKILSNRITGQVSEILRLAMQKGTGQKAKDSVQLSMEIENESLNIPIPSFGKTGTANRFTNSSFVGLIPGPKEDSGHLDIQEGYVIASYVGYDDNRPMKGQFINIYGASGALPLWIDTANAIANSQDFKKNMQIADLAFDSQSVPLINNKELQSIIISSKNGLTFRVKYGSFLKTSLVAAIVSINPE